MPDQIVGSYKITGIIGEGGMGKVFKGIDLMLEREVAIKSLRPEYARRPDIVERFRKEAKALATLNHPNIVTVYAFFRQGDDFFMVMEFVYGETLDKIIAQGKAIPWSSAVPLFCQALRGIGHAHSYGIIHRDIKPANMIITKSGLLKVMDFGIARVLGSAHLTRHGHLIGTIEYMSPEQIQGEDADTRSDIYSLGIVLYEMLAGRAPFSNQSEYELLKAQVEEVPKPMRHLAPDVPLEIEALLSSALAKQAEQRLQTVDGFREVLESLLFGIQSGSTSPQALSQTSPFLQPASLPGIERPAPASVDKPTVRPTIAVAETAAAAIEAEERIEPPVQPVESVSQSIPPMDKDSLSEASLPPETVSITEQTYPTPEPQKTEPAKLQVTPLPVSVPGLTVAVPELPSTPEPEPVELPAQRAVPPTVFAPEPPAPSESQPGELPAQRVVPPTVFAPERPALHEPQPVELPLPSAVPPTVFILERPVEDKERPIKPKLVVPPPPAEAKTKLASLWGVVLAIVAAVVVGGLFLWQQTYKRSEGVAVKQQQTEEARQREADAARQREADSTPAKSEPFGTIPSPSSGPTPNAEKQINPVNPALGPPSATTNQEKHETVTTKTKSAPVQGPPQNEQPQLTTETSPEETSSVPTSPAQVPIPSDRLSPSVMAAPVSPSIPAAQEPKPEKNKGAVQPRQPAPSRSASSSKKESTVIGNKSSRQHRARPSGRGGRGDWKIIY